MANDINSVILIGRLTKDVDIMMSESGAAVGKFTLANNRSYMSGGEWKNQVFFFDCVLFGKSAENLQKYCKKGDRISVEGMLQQSRWTDNKGNNHSKIQVAVKEYQLLESKKEKTEGPEKPKDNSVSSLGTQVDIPFEDNPFNDSEIPY